MANIITHKIEILIDNAKEVPCGPLHYYYDAQYSFPECEYAQQYSQLEQPTVL